MLVRGGSPTRYARRNPDSLGLDYCAKRLDAPPRVPLPACACVQTRAIRVFTIQINKLERKNYGVARGFLYNFTCQECLSHQGFSMSDQSEVNRRRRSLVHSERLRGWRIRSRPRPSPSPLSMLPSERAEALGAPVEADIGQLNPGEKMTVEWRGQPVWILHRSKEMLEDVKLADGKSRRPKSERKKDELTPVYARNDNRSIKPEYLRRGRNLHAPRLLAAGPAQSGSGKPSRASGPEASIALATDRCSTSRPGL